jgi:hypothetical protein
VNDSDRRRSPDGFDDDAIFADIIAHLLDDDADPQHPAPPVADDARTEEATIHQGPDTAECAGECAGDCPDADRADRADADRADLADEPASEGATAETTAPVPGEPQDVAAPQVWRAHQVADDEEDEHFEPRPVTPLPVGDLQFWAILAGMIGGPLLLIYLVFFNRTMSGYWTLTAIAMSVGGFALLVSRLPGNNDDEDDGARL